ncbi:MAG: hypothetical protein RBS91_01845 [Sulfurimonadaceae bacterium]|jgi:hypothetical protein|nr:hypothetical protein [Sulfurimonadaceae bacterium]
MHTLRLSIPDTIYPEIISFLKRYPTINIDRTNQASDFTASNIDEVKSRINRARKEKNFIEEERFWEEIDEHISKI